MSMNVPDLHRIEHVEYACEGVKVFRFHAPEIARASQPGQFLMVWLPRHDEIPISISDVCEGDVEIAIADVGDCTHRIHEKSAGDMLGLRGPFGRGFSFENVHRSKICLVAGGYGAAPLKFAARRLIERGARVYVLLGASTESNLLFVDDFRRMGCEVRIATDDGSSGFKGTVVELFVELFGYDVRYVDEVWTCGPEHMMYRICSITKNAAIKTQVAVERIIKCASGACDSCDIGGLRVCTEGPVFDADVLQDTEFGLWKRDESGMRVPVKTGNIISSPATPPIFIPEDDPMLESNVCGIQFKNPLMNASGFAISGKMLYRIAKSGAGAVVTKSIGLHASHGHPNPTFIEIEPQTYVNAMGLPNPGINAYKIEIEDAKRANVPLILSIFGRDESEWLKIVKIAVNYPIDMIELNVSCPHSGFKALENDPESLCKVVRKVSYVAHSHHIPVVVKISANTDDPAYIASLVEKHADAICAVNTLASKPVERSLGIPILGNPSGTGGISGKKIAEIGKKVVFRIAENVSIPVVAVGGIFSAKDVFDYAAAGASLFQIGSAIVSRGLLIFEEIKNELRKMLSEKGYKNVSEVVGMAHKR